MANVRDPLAAQIKTTLTRAAANGITPGRFESQFELLACRLVVAASKAVVPT